MKQYILMLSVALPFALSTAYGGKPWSALERQLDNATTEMNKWTAKNMTSCQAYKSAVQKVQNLTQQINQLKATYDRQEAEKRNPAVSMTSTAAAPTDTLIVIDDAPSAYPSTPQPSVSVTDQPTQTSGIFQQNTPPSAGDSSSPQHSLTSIEIEKKAQQIAAAVWGFKSWDQAQAFFNKDSEKTDAAWKLSPSTAQQPQAEQAMWKRDVSMPLSSLDASSTVSQHGAFKPLQLQPIFPTHLPTAPSPANSLSPSIVLIQASESFDMPQSISKQTFIFDEFDDPGEKVQTYFDCLDERTKSQFMASPSLFVQTLCKSENWPLIFWNDELSTATAEKAWNIASSIMSTSFYLSQQDVGNLMLQNPYKNNK